MPPPTARYGLGSPVGLIQQGADGDAGRPLGEKILLEEAQGVPRVQDILHHHQVPAGDILLDVLALRRGGGFARLSAEKYFFRKRGFRKK